MNVQQYKKYLLFLIIPLILCIGAIFLFYRMGRGDEQSISAFSAAYTRYETAFADYSRAVSAANPSGSATADTLESKLDAALGVMQTAASARISSLTRHDGDIMQTTLEIGSLSQKEVDTLKEYKNAVMDQSAQMGSLRNQLADLSNQRQAAYEHFKQLTGLNQ